VLAVLVVRDLAVATSGAYERGAHIVDPPTGRAPRELASVTVVGPRLGWADGMSTAAFVMGEAGLAWVEAQPGHAAFAVTADGRLAWTAAMESLLA
jgi:thiamine biosynthesis lipoprotein